MKRASNDIQPFSGFTPQGLKFFRDLDRNNNRDWFAEHRDEYVKGIAEPMSRLVTELGPMMLELDPDVVIDPKRTVSRIYRDTRFSNDKTPYRPRTWFAFKRNLDAWTSSPTYFFQIEEKQYLFGMGMYAASAATMRRFRQLIDDDPKYFAEIIEPVRKSKSLKLESDRYKRPLPCEHGTVIEPWYQSKSIAVLAYREPDKVLFSKKLVDFLVDQYVRLKPLYDFLWKATVL